jgi:chromosome segregation protein
LDGQIEDVQAALDQLQEAIRTLDKQTRAQFRAVFDAVNARIGPLFVQLFGGGEARLELSGADDLDAGVLLFAKPPGKKVTQLSLLSGGERALTAVALIFALFELNPAPFCILDEVDAPLDEANVGRFCAMVSAMSDRVQFLFVTHNKTTMASASALVGVTMREAGVSRIVSVDVDRAVQLLES